MSRRVFWVIGAGVAAVLIMTWYVGTFPSRIVVINQCGRTLNEVSITANGRKRDFGQLRSGESRILSVPGGSEIELRFRGTEVRRWRSPSPPAPGQSLVLYVMPGERIDPRGRLGSMKP